VNVQKNIPPQPSLSRMRNGRLFGRSWRDPIPVLAAILARAQGQVNAEGESFGGKLLGQLGGVWVQCRARVVLLAI